MADIIPEAKIMQYLDTFNRIADKKVNINQILNIFLSLTLA